MKRLLLIPLALTLAALVGCSGKVKVDTAKLEQPFQTAPSDLRTEISKAAGAIHTGDYAMAVTAFKAVAKKGSLNQQQKDAVIAAVSEMQMIASQDPNKYSPEVYRSIGELVPLFEAQPGPSGTPPATR